MFVAQPTPQPELAESARAWVSAEMRTRKTEGRMGHDRKTGGGSQNNRRIRETVGGSRHANKQSVADPVLSLKSHTFRKSAIRRLEADAQKANIAQVGLEFVPVDDIKCCKWREEHMFTFPHAVLVSRLMNKTVFNDVGLPEATLWKTQAFHSKTCYNDFRPCALQRCVFLRVQMLC